MTQPQPVPQALPPLWDYDRMGKVCAENATKRSRSKPRPTMDDIVKFAYEATMFAMTKEYEVDRAKLLAAHQQLEAHIAQLQQSLTYQFERIDAFVALVGKLEGELATVLDVAIARGASLGYEDDDYRALYQELTGDDWEDIEQ